MRISPSAAMAVLAAAVTGAALAIHAWHAVATGCYVDFVTGVWLALADDLARGVFYRDLIGPDGYGGTRYFPLFFASIAGLMRLGVAPLVSGFAVSGASAVLLVLGIRRFLLRIGLPGSYALACAVFVLAPRFSQQALFAIKSDFLAAGLVMWGLSTMLPAFDEERPSTRSLAAPAVFFVLAASTKVTSLYAPAAAVLALALASRVRTSLRLGALVTAGLAILVAMVAILSGGRAVESWRVLALAGADTSGWMRQLPSAFLSQVVLPSRVFGTVLAAATAAWLVTLRADGPRWLSVTLFPATLGAAVVVLASPGTSYTNQLTDLLAVCLVLIGWALARLPRRRPAAGFVLLLLSLAAARQSLHPVLDQELRHQAWQASAGRDEVIRVLASIDGPILSESPELLIMAGRRPYMLDPFALRIVARKRPDVFADVEGKLHSRFFSAVVLMHDPETRSGRGWYTNMDFGWPITSRILDNYELAELKPGLRVYRPKAVPQAAP